MTEYLVILLIPPFLYAWHKVMVYAAKLEAESLSWEPRN